MTRKLWVVHITSGISNYNARLAFAGTPADFVMTLSRITCSIDERRSRCSACYVDVHSLLANTVSYVDDWQPGIIAMSASCGMMILAKKFTIVMIAAFVGSGQG